MADKKSENVEKIEQNIERGKKTWQSTLKVLI